MAFDSALGVPLAWLRQRVASSDAAAAAFLLLAAFGLCAVLEYPLALLRVLLNFTHLASPFRLHLSRFQSRSGPPAWAVVTGPTGGIGKEFSLQLTRAGFSVFLVGRNPDKLDRLVGEVLAEASRSRRGSQPIACRYHAIDLGAATEADWVGLERALGALDAPVGVLVNNAGISHAGPVPFESTPMHEVAAIPALNVNAVLRVTRLVAPIMVNQRNGLILNLGSFSALVPTPMLATYAGTKGFLYTWSQALGAELAEKGIVVRLLNTYFVTSEMSKIKRPSFVIPSPRTYVRSTLSTLGLSGGALGKAYVSTPYLAHALIQWVVDRFGTEAMWLRYNLRMQKDIARRVERRRAREEAAKLKAA